jgi:uncharacterized protein YjiS (DUF1127 family)
MSTTYGATGSRQTAAWALSTFSFLKRYWSAFQERREREKSRAALSDLSDRELMDIGTTRAEVDYVASNRGIDPRGIRNDPLVWCQLGGQDWETTRRSEARLLLRVKSRHCGRI